MLFRSNLSEALFLVIGADLGTTMTALIGTIHSNPLKRKVGWSQVIFNAISDAAALIMVPLYLFLIRSVAHISDPLIVLVSFHSLMNLAGIAMVLPFIHPFARFIDRVIRTGNDKLCRFIELVHPTESQAAIDALHRESHLFFRRSVSLLRNYFGIENHQASRHVKSYNDLKNYENEIAGFYIKVQQHPLSPDNAAALNDCIAEIRNAAVAVKEIKDVVHNIDELKNTSHDELYAFLGKLHDHQKNFYDEVLSEMKNRGDEIEEGLSRLHEMIRSYHQYSSEDVYLLFSKHRHHEIMIPSMLNLIRAVNNSNECLLRAAGGYYNRLIPENGL